MWGGVKHRRQYGDLFRNWSATKGLESLRAALYTEPRPWFVAFSLHQHRHLLQDYQCARLLAWCTTVLQLRTETAAKKEAYRYTHETLHMLAHSHKVGQETLLQCFRLCAVGKDLTSAFNWYQYWIEAQHDGADTLWPLVWLLHIAESSPSDDSAEDMAVAVRDAYKARMGLTEVTVRGGGEEPCTHLTPQTQEEEAQWTALCAAFAVLRPRLRDADLLRFVDSLPPSPAWKLGDATVAGAVRGLPQSSHHHVFPQLEQQEAVVGALPPTVHRPYLRDSLLHSAFIARLEEAALEKHDAKSVVALLQTYKEEVQAEKLRRERKSERRSETELWRQYADPCAQRFRHALVEEGGLTPELYHYVVVALAPSQPSAALRTIQRMREANLRVLDLTRAVALVAAAGAPDEQLRLFKEQHDEMTARQRLDADYDICKAVEHYWKFEYTNLFHYQNRLEEQAFYRFLLDGIGPAALQRLLLDAQIAGPTATTEDLVVLNEPLRQALCAYFRQQTGNAAVEDALNAITRHVPKLDISLTNSVPHFAEYTLAESDSIATDMHALRDRLSGFSTVCVLDTSFVESSEGFLSLGTASGSEKGGEAEASTLVLVPFVVLQQLAESVAQSHTFVTFDPSLQDGLREEPRLASQRLRALAAMTTRPGTTGRQARLLHFSECLLAHAMTALPHRSPTPRDVQGTGSSGSSRTDDLMCDPAASDNDHLVLVVAMVRALCAPSAQVLLCTDDTTLEQRIEALASRQQLFAGPVQILRTQPPAQVVETDQLGGLVNDNPLLDLDAAAFEPKLSVSAAVSGRSVRTPPPDGISHTTARNEQAASDQGSSLPSTNSTSDASDLVDSPWLSLLSEEPPCLEETAVPDGAGARASIVQGSASPSSFDEQEARQVEMEKLMNLYESPHDVIPVGAKMLEASRLDSVFGEFDSADPYDRALAAEERAARQSQLEAESGGKRPRRLNALQKEFLSNRGASNKERYQLARSLSNQSGGRVPFNLRYKVVEANVNDPKNASLRRAYEQGVQRKRDHYKRTRQH